MLIILIHNSYLEVRGLCLAVSCRVWLQLFPGSLACLLVIWVFALASAQESQCLHHGETRFGCLLAQCGVSNREKWFGIRTAWFHKKLLETHCVVVLFQSRTG